MSTLKPFMGAMALLLMVSCNQSSKENKANDLQVVDHENQKSISNSPNALEDKKEIPVNGNGFTATDSTTQNPSPADSKSPNQAVKNAPLVANDWTKKLIKNSTVKLEVKDFKKYNDFLNTKLKQYGGYIAQEDNSLTEEKNETVMKVKVPVQFFDPLMNELSVSDGKLLEKSIQSEDVTGDIVDTKSRLEAKKQMRLKYLEFLKESKNMTEVLQVQDEINNIQEEIESASGRYASLSTQAAYSTINLTFFTAVAGYKQPDDSPSFFGKISSAFSTGSSWLASLFVGLVSIWPILLIIFSGVFIYKKRRPAKVLQQNV